MKGQSGDTAAVTTEVLRVLKAATKLMTAGEVYEAGQFEGPQPVYNALHAMSQVDMRIVRLKDAGRYLYGASGHSFEVPKPAEEKPMVEKETVGLDRFNKRFAKEAELNRKFSGVDIDKEIEIPTLVPKQTIRDIADKYVGPYAGAIKELENAMGAALLKADKCRVAIEALKAL